MPLNMLHSAPLTCIFDKVEYASAAPSTFRFAKSRGCVAFASKQKNRPQSVALTDFLAVGSLLGKKRASNIVDALKGGEFFSKTREEELKFFSATVK